MKNCSNQDSPSLYLTW